MRFDEQSRGVLDEAVGRGVYQAQRVLADDDLAAHVAYFWLVRWRLDAPYTQEVVTLPSAHFVFEQNDVTSRRAARFAGPGRRRFTRQLAGAGHIVGIALQAGTAFEWIRRPLAGFVDRRVPLRSVWRREVGEAERLILGASGNADAVAQAESFIRRWKPTLGADARLAATLVERIAKDRELCRVEHLVTLSGLSERALQRLFRRHVGISPKVVIRRFRLVEAADALERRKVRNLSRLALELGYYDQAHFVRDFKATVGRVPSALRR